MGIHLGRWLKSKLGLPTKRQMAVVRATAYAEMEHARRSSATLRQLRPQLAAMLGGRRCLIIGSAPDIVAPDLTGLEATVCANGSGWSALQIGIDCPDLTVVSSFVTVRDKEVRSRTVEMWHGLETRHLLWVAGGQDVEASRRVIDEAGLRYHAFTPISKMEFAAIGSDTVPPERVLSRDNDRISMGIFAATVALWAGAREIVLAGFSLQGGHHYLDTNTPRNHVGADEEFFATAASQEVPLTTTCRAIHVRFGIPLAG